MSYIARRSNNNNKTFNSSLPITESKILSLQDNETYQNCTNTAAITITIPAAIFSDNAAIEIARNGIGDVIISPETGIVLNGSSNSLNITSQYRVALIRKISSNNWIAIGSII